MLTKLYSWLMGLLSRPPARLAIVRRYADANGNYVGELYQYKNYGHSGSYCMVGMSLDSMPIDYLGGLVGGFLDTRHDFLALMPKLTIRVGALDPIDNDKIRAMIDGLSRRGMTVIVYNRFIERVLERKGDIL